MASVKITNLKVSYKRRKTHQSINIDSIEVESGKIVGFFGPNHVGKSTLLKFIGQHHSELKIHSHSQILYNSEEFKRDNNSILIFHIQQDYTNSIFPWFSIKENLRIFMKSLNFQPDKIDENANKFYIDFGYNDEMGFLTEYGFAEGGNIKKVSELSGGQQQIITIVRALMSSPTIITMDEPFSAIDIYKGRLFRQKVLSFLESKKITTFIVSHELEDLLSFADEIYFFNHDAKGEILKGKETIGTAKPGSNLSDAEIEEYSNRLKTMFSI